jgi:hypothetical protein
MEGEVRRFEMKIGKQQKNLSLLAESARATLDVLHHFNADLINEGKVKMILGSDKGRLEQRGGGGNRRGEPLPTSNISESIGNAFTPCVCLCNDILP